MRAPRSPRGPRGLFRYRGLMVLVLWQTPLPIDRDPETGNVRYSFGAGMGSYELNSIDCDGNVMETMSGEHREAGALLELQPSKNTKAAIAGGVLADDGTELFGEGVSNGGTRPYVVGTLSIERSWFGVGPGSAIVRETLLPSGHLRAGSLDGVHVIFDGMPPEAPYGTTGEIRLGIGYNNGWKRGFGMTAGVALCYYCWNSEAVGVFGKVHVPVGPRMDLTFAGILASGEMDSHSAFSLGGRITGGQ